MNNEAVVERLERLRDEHEVLDQRIGEMNSEGVFNDVHILRLKKQKLAIKDQMGQLENNLVPNLIA